MTVAPGRPPHLRFLAVVGVTALCLLLGVLALQQYGAGPALFLFALAAVGAVDAGLLWTGPAGRRSGGTR